MNILIWDGLIDVVSHVHILKSFYNAVIDHVLESIICQYVINVVLY